MSKKRIKGKIKEKQKHQKAIDGLAVWNDNVQVSFDLDMQ